jgi:hypothetical protein
LLFDLHGKRRRVVQATYLTLAILMGGGLVLFGIGSDVQGGLADIFTGDGGHSDNPALEEQLEEAEARLATDPDDPQALAGLVRANFQLATTTDEQARSAGLIFAEDATPRLAAAAEAWERYLALEPKRPDDSLAFLMIQVYGEQGLNEPAEAAEAARIVADERRSTQAYLILTQYAALAGDERAVELAGRRAVELAPPAQREPVERQVQAIEDAAEALPGAQDGDGGGGIPGGAPESP